MSKTLTIAGVDYDISMLFKIKGQGTVTQSDSIYCITDGRTLVDAKIKNPVVARTIIDGNDRLYVIIRPQNWMNGPDDTRPKGIIDVCLLSKHILKKAKVETLKALATAQEPPARPLPYRSHGENESRFPRNNGFDGFDKRNFHFPRER